MEKFRECPICHVIPDLDYACGDHFMHCTDECKAPMCDHASRKGTVDHWNGWVEEYWQRNSWIPTSERLPDTPKDVLAWAQNAGVWIGYYNALPEFESWMYGAGKFLPKVTHWMPLPEPPKD